ncbi:hypothetical protein EON83_11140 [bacterium]|nr:MAG: hypothetical protein EON83_11140 [bacterium]
MISPEQELEICDLYTNQGLGCRRLGAKYGVHKQKITNIIKKHGLQSGQHQRRVELDPDTEKEIARLYKEGQSAEEVASLFGISRMVVRRILKAHSVAAHKVGGVSKPCPQKRILSADAERQVCELYSSDTSQTLVTIASRFGCSDKTVLRALKRNGVQTRPNVVEFTTSLKGTEQLSIWCSAITQGVSIEDWQGYSPRPKGRWGTRYIRWRKEVLERDNRWCQKCGHDQSLVCHHIYPWTKYPDKRYDVDNGITLCRYCHNKIQSREEQYVNYFKELLRQED